MTHANGEKAHWWLSLHISSQHDTKQQESCWEFTKWDRKHWDITVGKACPHCREHTQRSQSCTSHHPSLTSPGFNHHLGVGWQVQSNPRTAFTLKQTWAAFFCCFLVLFLVMKSIKNGVASSFYISPIRLIFCWETSATQHYPGNVKRISTEQI